MKLCAAARAIFGIALLGIGELRPVGAQALAVEHARGELLRVRGGAHELALRAPYALRFTS